MRVSIFLVGGGNFPGGSFPGGNFLGSIFPMDIFILFLDHLMTFF